MNSRQCYRTGKKHYLWHSFNS